MTAHQTELAGAAPTMFPIQPANGGPAVIMTTMKNEGPFMLEWIAHNLTIGFTGFVIFTNDCKDGTDLMAQRLDELGFASHRPNEIFDGSSPQRRALRRARAHPWVEDADWLICMDVDEYLNFRNGVSTLDEFMAAIGDCDAVSLTWKLFGCGGIDAYEDRPVTEQFFLGDGDESYANGRAQGFKTLFRNNGVFSRYNPHRPILDDDADASAVKWSDCGGNHTPAQDVGWQAWKGFSHQFARLNHYSVRSLESFLVKRDRGRTNHIARDQAEHYWADMNVNRVRDDSILPHVERARPMLEALKSDPVLAELHAQAVDWHRAKINELKTRPEYEEFHDWLREHAIETTFARGEVAS